MLFNSLPFIIFFPVVILMYWMLGKKWRNGFLLIASYYFYMCWDARFALLILFSTITTWLCGITIEKRPSNKKQYLTLCLIINFTILILFKYLNFLGSLVTQGMSLLHIDMIVPDMEILLPVGISFFTFQAVGYTIDVYRGTISAERNFLTYALFVSFFPQLVAGPIERAKNLLPQFHRVHRFRANNVIHGLELIVLGYFMKLCIADGVSPYVDAVYGNIQMHNGTSILLATIFFTFQIFCDFGGYSLIAIGTARCMGFNLMQNFKQPYLSTSVKDFWRRWHVSLSSWFADYLYKPLGGSRCSKLRHKGNLILTFMASGLWHGANMTFVAWGAYHGTLQVIHSVAHPDKKPFFARRWLIIRLLSVATTFVLIAIGWVLFRAESISDAMLALKKIATSRGMLYNGEGKPAIILSLLLIALLMVIEIFNRHAEKKHTGLHHDKHIMLKSILMTSFLIVVILMCGHFNGGQFIYFQF